MNSDIKDYNDKIKINSKIISFIVKDNLLYLL